jgi:Uma2 family endonuclease
MSSTRSPATYADIEALPERFIGEILDDELIVSSRLPLRQSVARGSLIADLVRAFQRGRREPDAWWILPGPELHLAKNVLVPDVAGWQRRRLPVLPDAVGIPLAPDWLCEVLSPTTERIDRRKKLRVYARSAVGHVWLVDAVLRTLEVYRRVEEHWLLVDVFGDDDRVRIEPFEAIELDLSLWWYTPDPAPRSSTML